MKPFLVLLLASIAGAQDFSQKGFFELNSFVYPQTAPGDGGHVVSGMVVRYEASYKLSGHLRFSGGIDLQTDTHRETERLWRLSYWDRGLERQPFDIRRLSMTYTQGRFTLELGKQLIRWGKADLLSPTDRFAPRDFLNPIRPDYMPVTAVHLTYGLGSDTLEAVYTPRFTPSRIPLIEQRWAQVPAGVQVNDTGSRFPGGPQFGVRWDHTGGKVEYSLSLFDGYHDRPVIDVSLRRLFPPAVDLLRMYPKIRSAGTALVIPVSWFTIRTEAAYFQSRDRWADQYALYVIQLERQSGEWFLTAGYTDQQITDHRAALTFDPDRGLARSFMGHASYTIDTNRSIEIEGAVRKNGDGALLKVEYSQAIGQHWRATTGITWIRGVPSDFLGQYRRNSYYYLTLRYSF